MPFKIRRVSNRLILLFIFLLKSLINTSRSEREKKSLRTRKKQKSHHSRYEPRLYRQIIKSNTVVGKMLDKKK